MRILLSAVLMIICTIATADDNDALEREVEQVVATLLTEFKTALTTAMKEDGPPAAVGVCRDVAPGIYRDIALARGWRVTRVGTRVRNPLFGTPDAWEQAGLAEFRQRQADGETLESMTRSETVREPGGRYYRHLSALGTQPVCTTCHGPRDEIAPDIRAMLDEQYPHDRAVGYAAGDLRGAVSVKVPLAD